MFPVISSKMKSIYPSNLTEQQWEIIRPLIPNAKSGGRPRTTDMRSICNAIFYYLKTECQWAYLPKEFPPYSTVYKYYRQWEKKGVWSQINFLPIIIPFLPAYSPEYSPIEEDFAILKKQRIYAQPEDMVLTQQKVFLIYSRPWPKPGRVV